MPGNVNSFLAILVPLVQFDILDSSWTTEKILEVDEEDLEERSSDIPDQTKNLGFDTHNSVLNLGSIGIFSFLYYTKLAVVLVPVFLFSKISKMGQSLVGKLTAYMIFTEILEINFDGFLEMIIAGALSWKETSFGDDSMRQLQSMDFS